MNRNIDTIFFDVGATLRYVVEDAEFSAAADRELMELVGATESHDVFFEKLNKNWKAYRKMAKTVLLDVSEMELWLQYLLPDYPAEVIAPSISGLMMGKNAFIRTKMLPSTSMPRAFWLSKMVFTLCLRSAMVWKLASMM